jgi:hypothetical protein
VSLADRLSIIVTNEQMINSAYRAKFALFGWWSATFSAFPLIIKGYLVQMSQNRFLIVGDRCEIYEQTITRLTFGKLITRIATPMTEQMFCRKTSDHLKSVCRS